MWPLKLTIPGRYWDTQIYRGRLYLFEVDGSILTLDWDRLIQDMRIEHSLKIALVWAFQRSDYLYRLAATGIFHDEEFKAMMNRRFSTLARTPLILKEEQLKEASLGQQANRFPFPHADSTVYTRRLYISSRSGLFSANCMGQTKYPISTHVKKLWDCPVLAVGASYGALALAAGEEGLWETDTFETAETASVTNPHHLAERHCNECEWAFHSIYGSSSKGPGVLAAYHKTRTESGTPGRTAYQREFDRLIPEEEIFPDSEEPEVYSWAAQDKICQAANGTIRVARYQPWDKRTPLQLLGDLALERHGEAIVSAKVALFGTVVELDSSLVVLSSNGTILSIDGEPVSWRVFPRSRHYENHLHVIYDDRLEIFSFNHDCLIDQQKKISGISNRAEQDRISFDSSGF